jgi:hypothetical protein
MAVCNFCRSGELDSARWGRGSAGHKLIRLGLAKIPFAYDPRFVTLGCKIRLFLKRSMVRFMDCNGAYRMWALYSKSCLLDW